MEKKRQPQSAKAQKAQPEDMSLPVRYIRQPYPISAWQADLSKQQIRILVGMMQSIQDGVQKMFKRGANEKNQLLLFPDMQDDHVNIDFKFSDIAVRPDAYRDVAAIAKKFMDMVISYEDKERGEVTLKHFVDEVTYPKRGSKRDKIRFSFTRKQAEEVFNFTMYSRYMLSVAAEAESKHTARIYMLITSARGFDRDGTGIFHWYVTYEELRRMLGCDEKEYKDDKDTKGHWVRKRQKLYKHFKADVLRVAEDELKRLFDAGKCDCWFEFIELPDDFVGEPQRFDFVVHAVDTVGAIQITAAPSKAIPAEDPGQEKLRTLLLSLGLSATTADDLITKMSGRLADLSTEACNVQLYIAAHPEVKSPRDCAAKMLYNFVNGQAAGRSGADTPAAPADYAKIMMDAWNNNGK